VVNYSENTSSLLVLGYQSARHTDFSVTTDE